MRKTPRRPVHWPGWIAVVATATLQGCISLAPDYERPSAPVPHTYPAAGGDSTKGVPASSVPWQSYFTDPVLTQLSHNALGHKRYQSLVALRVEGSRAAYGLERSDRFPHVGAGAQAARARVPGDLSPLGGAMTGSEYRAEVGLTTWELDLWGRVR